MTTLPTPARPSPARHARDTPRLGGPWHGADAPSTDPGPVYRQAAAQSRVATMTRSAAARLRSNEQEDGKAMKLPTPRGPISGDLFEALRRHPGPMPAGMTKLTAAEEGDSRVSEDIQITLFACYALHYDGFSDVDDRWEWCPPLLALRAELEHLFERDLVASIPALEPVAARNLPSHLLDWASPTHGSALDSYAHKQATLDQFRELIIHRSIKNLREGDQHTWAIPRLTGRAKSALVTIQADEYGGGRPGWMHAELYAQLMRELDLDPDYGAYIERIPALSVAAVNVMSLFGLHRRWRGAQLGNLAVIEIGSSVANRRYSEGLARVGASPRARAFYDEHIEADAVHEQIAAHDMCGGFAAQHPAELDRVLFGARSTMTLRGEYGAAVLEAWGRGASSLRPASAA